MDFHGYYTGDPNNWYQSRSILRESAAAYGGNYHDSHFYGYSHHHQFDNPHLWMNSPNPIPSNPSFYHHTSYCPPTLPNHTIINGHSLPLQFPFSSQSSQPMNHQLSQPICYPQSQPYNSYVHIPTPQFQAQSTEILPTKATTIPPIYQPSPHVPQHDLFTPTETNPIDQVTYSQFSYASLHLEDTKVAGSVGKSSPHNEYAAESGQNLGVSANPLNMEHCLQMPDHETNGAIDEKSVSGLTPLLAFATSKGQANIVLENAFNSIKDGAQGVCENAAEDSEAINLHQSCKDTSDVLDKSSFWDCLRRNGYKMLVNIDDDNCAKPPYIFHRYDYLHDIAIEAFSKEEFHHIFIALVYNCSKLCPFEVRRDFLWNMLEPNFAAMIMSCSPLVNVTVEKESLPTIDRMVELKQNVGMLFERVWEHWESKPITETSLADIGDVKSAMKFFLHNLEQLIHCCNIKASEPKDLVLACEPYTIQSHMVASIIVALSALPFLLLPNKSLSSLDELLYDILFGRLYNVLKFHYLVQTAIHNSKLSAEMTQGQAGMRLLVVNLVFGLFTWLHGHLRVDLDSSVQDSLVLKCMKAITHYCSHIIAGIQIRNQSHFIQITGFWFNGDEHWNVLQGLMEFEIMIRGNETTIELCVQHDAVVENHQQYLPTLSSVQYQILCSILPTTSWHDNEVLPIKLSLSHIKKGLLLAVKAILKGLSAMTSWFLCAMLKLGTVATLNAWINDTFICAPLANKWEKLMLLIAGWFEKMEGNVNFFSYMEPGVKCLGSVMLVVGVTVSIWDALPLIAEVQKCGLCLVVLLFGSFYNNNKHDGNPRDFNELWSTMYVFPTRLPQLQITAKVKRSVVTLLIMFAISSLLANKSGKCLDYPIHSTGFEVTISLSIAFLDLLICGFVDKYFDVLAAMLVMERLLRDIVTMFNHMLLLRYMKGFDFLQTHLLMGNSHIILNEILGKLRSKPNSQNLHDMFSAYASVSVVEEVITSLELMEHESQIHSVDVKALMASAIIQLNEAAEITKGMAKMLRAFVIYTAFNYLANHPSSNSPEVLIEHFIDIAFMVHLHETIMESWLGAYDEESRTERNCGRLIINMFGSHHFCTHKMLQHHTCLQLIMRKLIREELQVGTAWRLESTDIITRPVKMFNLEWGNLTATGNSESITVRVEPHKCCYQIRDTFASVNMGKFHPSQDKLSVHETTKMTRLVDKEADSFRCFPWGITSFIFYFGIVSTLSIYGSFWYNILGAAFDNEMTLKLLSIVDSTHGISLKTLGLSLQGMRTCLNLRGRDC